MPRLSSDELSDVVAHVATAVSAAAASIGNSSSMSTSPSVEHERYPMITSDLGLKRRRIATKPSSSTQPPEKKLTGTAARKVISDGPLRAVPCVGCVRRIADTPGVFACHARIGTRGVAGRSCATCSRRGRKCTPVPNYANAPQHASRLAEADRELLASRGTNRESAAFAAFELAVTAAKRSLREAQRTVKNKAMEGEAEEEAMTHVNIRMGVIDDDEGNAGQEEDEDEEDEYDDDDDCEEEREARARLREMAKRNGTWTGHQNSNSTVQPSVPTVSADDDLAKAVYVLAKSAHELSVAAANVAELMQSRSQR